MKYFLAAKYIQTIAEARSISAAAEKLGISQPALSAHLKKQEEQMGAILFDRTKQPLELTEAGKVYLQYAGKAQTLQREFSQHIADLQTLKRGSLTVGGAGSFNISYLPEAVAAFTAKYPGIEFEIVDGNIPEITMKAVNGQIDLFIAPPWKRDDRLQYEPLMVERIFLCVPPEWDINRQLEPRRIPVEAVLTKAETAEFPQVDFHAFRKLPFVLLKEDQHIGHVMSSLFEKYGFVPKKYTMAEQTLTSYSLTLAGVGISLMTESTIRNSGFSRHPALYMPDPEICRRTMYAAYSKQKYLSKAAVEFIQTLKETL